MKTVKMRYFTKHVGCNSSSVVECQTCVKGLNLSMYQQQLSLPSIQGRSRSASKS